MSKILVLPDTQCRPGDDFAYLNKIGHYIVEKTPDTIVCIGDFADLPSLSSYDIGKKSFEGRRYKDDVQATHEAMTSLLEPMWTFNERAKKNKEKLYKPRMVLTYGNHCERINRAVENDPKLEGMLSLDDLRYKDFGWETIPFLETTIINGIAFSHYFQTGVAGRPASTAAAQFRVANMSCISGHQQGLQFHTGKRADGKRLTSVIAGSCYEHQESYLGAQGNAHWRGFLVLHGVDDGQFDLMTVSLDYINSKYA